MWGEFEPVSPAHYKTQRAGTEYEDKMDRDASEPSTPTAQVRSLFKNRRFMFKSTKPPLSKMNILVARSLSRSFSPSSITRFWMEAPALWMP